MTNSALLNESVPDLDVDIQNVISEQFDEPAMSDKDLLMWASSAYRKVSQISSRSDSQMTIRLVDEEEITQLNNDYRGKNKATNVLSFPFENDFPEMPQIGAEDDDLMAFNLLGDVIICHSVIVKEAQMQSKSVYDHYAHMVVHGVLHLCGYDHQDDLEAQTMEQLEVEILAQHEIANPYS